MYGSIVKLKQMNQVIKVAIALKACKSIFVSLFVCFVPCNSNENQYVDNYESGKSVETGETGLRQVNQANMPMYNTIDVPCQCMYITIKTFYCTAGKPQSHTSYLSNFHAGVKKSRNNAKNVNFACIFLKH